MKIYNLTGESVKIALDDGNSRVFPAERFTAKAQQEHVAWDDTDGIPTMKTAWHISGLPAPQKDILYIVPAGVLLAALVSGRTVVDLRAPANSVPGKKGEYEKLVMA